MADFIGQPDDLNVPSTRLDDARPLGEGPWNAPVSLKEQSFQTFGFELRDAQARYERLGKEAMNTTIGPMPVEDFFDAFLPWPDVYEGMPSATGAFVDTLGAKTEKDLYLPLISALNGLASADPQKSHGPRCPGFTFRQTCDHADTSGGRIGSIKPDILCYADRHLARLPEASDDPADETDMGFAAMFIEVKVGNSDDYFQDPPLELEKEKRESWAFALGRYHDVDTSTRDRAVRDFGQSVAYAVQICARQHRHCCFSVTVAGTTARFIRWDRAGAIASEGFDIIAEPHLLCGFFWRFAHVSDSARGYDLTVHAATSTQEDLFRSAIKAHVSSQLYSTDPLELEKALDVHYAPGFVTSIRLPDMSVDSTCIVNSLLVSRPITIPLSTTGRATRAYWAVLDNNTSDTTSKRPVYVLKDTWRRAGPGDQPLEREGDILLSLHEHGVENIPPLAWHGDVPLMDTPVGSESGSATSLGGSFKTQETTTDNCIDESWVCGSRQILRQWIAKRIHYRLLLGIAGFTLLHLSGTSELLHAMHDAFRALKGAYDNAHRVHRDVTPGNVILYHDPSDPRRSKDCRRGYLIDWDQSCNKIVTYEEYDYLPSLSWQFASRNVLSGGKHGHGFSDDMESILYVVLYCGLIRLRHNLEPDQLLATFRTLLDINCQGRDGTARGGLGKLDELNGGVWTGRIRWIPHPSPMKTWIETAYRFLRTSTGPTSITPSLGQWTGDNLDRFWTTFLSETSLPTRDSLNVIVSMLPIFERRAPQGALGTPSQPTISPGHKRPAPDTLESVRKNKRARVGKLAPRTRSKAQLQVASKRPMKATPNPYSTASSSHLPSATYSYATGPSATVLDLADISTSALRSIPVAPPSFPSPDEQVMPPESLKKEGSIIPAPPSFPSPDEQVLPPESLEKEGPIVPLPGPSSTKKTKYLRVSRTSLTALNICKREYKASHPGATTEEFDNYWESLGPADLELYNKRSEQEKLERRNEECRARRVGTKLRLTDAQSSFNFEP